MGENLPEDALYEILMRLHNYEDIINFCNTNKIISNVCNSNYFWQQKYNQLSQIYPDILHLPILGSLRNTYRVYSKQPPNVITYYAVFNRNTGKYNAHRYHKIRIYPNMTASEIVSQLYINTNNKNLILLNQRRLVSNIIFVNENKTITRNTKDESLNNVDNVVIFVDAEDMYDLVRQIIQTARNLEILNIILYSLMFESRNINEETIENLRNISNT